MATGFLPSTFYSLLSTLYYQPSTLVERPLQIHLFLQNEPKLPNTQMNVTSTPTGTYVNLRLAGRFKNEAKTKPNEAKLKKAEMNVFSVITRAYENKPQFQTNESKPNSNPIKPNSNPIKPNFKPFTYKKSSKSAVKNRKKLTLLILTLGFCLAGCAVNPITGEKHLNFFTPQQEIEIGKSYAPQIEEQMGGRIENVTLQNYLNNVGQKVAKVSHRPDWDYHFVALEHKSVNAFALPGGYVFITRGMLEKLETEAQLASILAHETVHIVARHSSRAMTKQIGYQMVLSTITSEETSKTVLNVADLTWQIVGLKYSRADEQEADSEGLDYLVSAGYNPYAMVETMQMLQSQQKIRPVQFLSTHPAPENRIEYLTRKIQTTYYDLAELKIGTDDYQRAVLDQLAN